MHQNRFEILDKFRNDVDAEMEENQLDPIERRCR